MRKLAILLLLFFVPIVFVTACGEETDDDGESCPSFNDRQLLPDVGEPDTEFVLWVELKSKNVNRQIESLIANAFFADGRSANKTFDLVRVEDKPYKYLRTFKGDEVCDSGVCTLFFQVVARHEDGCARSFDTPLFQVVCPDQGDDDDTAAASD